MRARSRDEGTCMLQRHLHKFIRREGKGLCWWEGGYRASSTGNRTRYVHIWMAGAGLYDTLHQVNGQKGNHVSRFHRRWSTVFGT